MRAPDRSPLPNMSVLLDETNLLLAINGLPTCHAVAPVSDGDTANPTVIAYSNERKYVVKVTQRYPYTLDRQRQVANGLCDTTNLPIPRHYCCANERSRLPLMIMEWLPGEQLRLVLVTAKRRDLRILCNSLAVCLATFHNPDHLTLVPKAEGGFAKWLYTRTTEALQSINRVPPPSRFGSFDVVAVQRYLDTRFGSLEAPAIPALQKADHDLRDYLADPNRFEITGMLDWERVTRGDGVCEMALIFLRLWLNGKLDGWKFFLATYNAYANVQAEQCPQAEFYLMSRAVLAFRFNYLAKEIVDLLLQGHRFPFESNTAGS